MKTPAPIEIEVVQVNDESLDLEGYVVVNSLSNGMAFGGCRFDPSVTREDVMHLAQCMTWKLASHGLPVGGAKGGLRVDPKDPRILEKVAAFGRAASRVLENRAVLGKDLGASNELLDHLYASISLPQMHIVRRRFPSSSVPERLRDLKGYIPHMTGQGVAWAARAALNGAVSGKRVLIQGAGAVGLGSAFRLVEMGARIVGMNDQQTALFKPEGFSMDELSRLISGGLIQPKNAGAGVKVLKRDELLRQDADVLILAAGSNLVDGAMAEAIQCPLVIEGSNFGLLPEGRAVLFRRGIMAVPDVLANSASGAMVAFQMSSGNKYSIAELWPMIERNIDSNVRSTLELARTEKMDPRDAYVEIRVPKLLAKLSEGVESR